MAIEPPDVESATAPTAVPTRPAFDPSALIRKAKPGEGLVARGLRVAKGVLTSSGETRAMVRSWSAVQQPMTTGLRIAVIGARGGAATSTTTALIGLTYAELRNDPILAIDLDATPGALAWRLGAAEQPDIEVVYQHLRGSHGGFDTFSLDEVPRGTHGLRVLAALPSSDADAGRAVGGDVVSGVSRHFALTIIDCGRGLFAPQQAALRAAHATVLVVPLTAEGVHHAERAAEEITADGAARSPARVILVFVEASPAARDVRVSRAQSALRRYARTSIVMPYDRHLGSGGLLVPTMLGEPARQAVRAIAGNALDAALGAPVAEHSR